MTHIVGVFITFENNDSVKKAHKLCLEEKITLLKQDTTMVKASEPSDYIWENMGYSRGYQKFYFWIVVLLLGIIIYVAYRIQFSLL